ncbi:unnamed protein product [Tuber melanosporum]|uniref:(Perigord truffle) hypothetical protein n=1 Tax=Tuber melanosporum (strain Mel28) TaxID=656061 RepID=D5GM00_TUBMM|nr:uncharacterized protein GSTUM_00010339001 [Tuber melanosporum]CAZ85462.1 unnamed protein product [Tuber melanosporum]
MPPQSRLVLVSGQRSFHTSPRWREFGEAYPNTPSALDVAATPPEELPQGVPHTRPLFNLPSARQSSLRLSRRDLERLEKHLEDRDLPGGYATWLEISGPRHGNIEPTSEQVTDEAIKPVVELLLEGLIEEGPQHRELPPAAEFLETLRSMALANDSQYRLLLTSMLQQGKSPELVAPVLDSAIQYYKEDHFKAGARRQTVEGGEETSDIDRDMLWSSLRSGFWLSHSPSAIASTIYLTFLHTMEVATQHHRDLERTLFVFPQLPNATFLGKYMAHHYFEEEMQIRLVKLAEKFGFKKLITVPGLLQRETDQYKDGARLKDYYDSLRTQAESFGIPLLEENFMVFVMAFMSLAEREVAIEIWNDMARSGILPRPRSWNMLLVEAGRLQDRDRSCLQAVWKTIITSGVVPDVILWTTRIHALFMADRAKEGMKVLKDMQNSGLKPTTATINAVLDGLLKHQHMDEAKETLQVATRMGIKSDLTTYNTMLRALLRSKKFNEAISLLQEMQAAGINADIVTATTVLDGMYKNSPTKPDLAKVKSLLEYMEAVGVPANEVTFTTIIEGLLETRNEQAAQDIWEIMESKGLKPTSATYTIVIRYAFWKGDLLGVEKLLQQVEANHVPKDQKLWTRLAVGYAQMGEVERLRSVMAAMEEEKKTLPLSVYTSIVRALGRENLYDDVKEVVKDALEKDMISSDGSVRAPAERMFWQTLEEMAEGTVLMDLKAQGLVTV